jgi:hypothetical protein
MLRNEGSRLVNPQRSSHSPVWKIAGVVLLIALFDQCGPARPTPVPAIEFSRLPRSDSGGTESRAIIEGHVDGARGGQQIVLFAKSAGVWWVQPFFDQPFTDIRADKHWENSTHLGTEYAALLVEPGYQPPERVDRLPQKGGPVIAVVTAKGEPQRLITSRTLHFSGYEWEIRGVPSNRGGAENNYDPANAWTDSGGRLHLRIARGTGEWTCAEVTLTRSLGYGSYSFDVQDISSFEPAAVLGLFTWDDSLTDTNHREMDTEISRWGEPGGKNAQYVVQPYYIPANVVRFSAPSGRLTYSFNWQPGRVTFRTGHQPGGGIIAEHTFTSGVPLPGGEAVHINLYAYANNNNSPLQHEVEVVIEKFQYLP